VDTAAPPLHVDRMTGHQPSCGRTSATASAASAAIAVLLSPIPLLDEVVLVPVYASVVARLARIHRVPLSVVPWRAFAASTFNGLLARAGVNLAVAIVPIVSAVADAATASTLTMSLTRYFDDALADPEVEPAVLGMAGLRDELARVMVRRSVA
jgi:uncharacterized protein (DUF697 family)